MKHNVHIYSETENPRVPSGISVRLETIIVLTDDDIHELALKRYEEDYQTYHDINYTAEIAETVHD